MRGQAHLVALRPEHLARDRGSTQPQPERRAPAPRCLLPGLAGPVAAGGHHPGRQRHRGGVGARQPRHERGAVPVLFRALRQPHRGLDGRIPDLRPRLGAHRVDPGEGGAGLRVLGLGDARHLSHLRHSEPLHKRARAFDPHTWLGKVLHTDDVVVAARALAAAGLVTAFGHVSVRTASRSGFLITPPKPLGTLRADEPLQEVPLIGDGLPDGVPKEAWIHRAIYEARPDVGAICRAQPQVATAVASAGLPMRVLHGHAAFLGRGGPVYGDARLIRERDAGEALARSLGDAGGVVMRGNGAVTVGVDVGAAVARMWVLERSAEINRDASSAGSPEPLSDIEFAYWESVSEEILVRIWTYLRDS